jgi:hypothetical protein
MLHTESVHKLDNLHGLFLYYTIRFHIESMTQFRRMFLRDLWEKQKNCVGQQ